MKVIALSTHIQENHHEIINKVMSVLECEYNTFDLNLVAIENIQNISCKLIIAFGKWAAHIAKLTFKNIEIIQLPPVDNIHKSREQVFSVLVEAKKLLIPVDTYEIKITDEAIEKLLKLEYIVCRDKDNNEITICIKEISTPTTRKVILSKSELETIKLAMDVFKNREVDIIVSDRNANDST